MQLQKLSLLIDEKFHQDYSDCTWASTFTASYCKQNNKKNLLVTIGESWTNFSISHKDLTPEEFWGLDLAYKLNSDWLNIAVPGYINHWMLENLLWSLDHLKQLPYQHIDIVLCHTELGRELNDYKAFNYDFIKELAPRIQHQGLDSILDFQIEKTFEKLQTIIANLPKNANLVIGHNFSDIGKRLQIYPQLKPFLLVKSWTEILADVLNLSSPPLFPIGQATTIDQYRKFLHDESLFAMKSISRSNWYSTVDAWSIDHIDNTHRLLDWYSTCPGVGRPESTKHPNSLGKSIWTDYLEQVIKNPQKRV